MALVSDIVYPALRLMGIRDTTNATRMAEAVTALNNMLSSWDESLLINTTESLTLTAGDAEYSIGDGGDFDTVRPIRIESAFIRDSANYDYELDVYYSREEFNRLEEKNTDGRPSALLYELEYPLGKIYFDSEPESAETLYLTSKKPLQPYTALTDTILQPFEWEKAMIYNLAVDLAPEYNQQLLQTVIEQSMILKNQIFIRNVQVPDMEYDIALRR